MIESDRRAIFQRIAAEAGKVRPVFQTHAEAALKVRRALENADCTADQAARLIRAEPLLTARVVAMANSVACNRSGRAIVDLKEAVSRLGFRTVRALATAVVVQQMMAVISDPRHRELAAQLWEHTAHVAALAHVIALRVTRLDHETALFVGIVHEVGGFYLLARAHEFPGLLDGDPAELAAAWCGEGEALIGHAVLQALNVPEAAQQAVESFWHGSLARPPVSLGDTLLLAEALAPVASPLPCMAEDAESRRQVDLDQAIDGRTLSAILQESAEEVRSVAAALH